MIHKKIMVLMTTLIILGGFILVLSIKIPLDIENFMYLIGGIISILTGVSILMNIQKFDQKI